MTKREQAAVTHDRPQPSKELRKMVARLRGTACSICGKPVDLRSGDTCHIDHILPVSKYPHLADRRLNLALAHPRCNVRAGDLDPLGGEINKIHEFVDGGPRRNYFDHESEEGIALWDAWCQYQRDRAEGIINETWGEYREIWAETEAWAEGKSFSEMWDSFIEGVRNTDEDTRTAILAAFAEFRERQAG